MSLCNQDSGVILFHPLTSRGNASMQTFNIVAEFARSEFLTLNFSAGLTQCAESTRSAVLLCLAISAWLCLSLGTVRTTLL